MNLLLFFTITFSFTAYSKTYTDKEFNEEVHKEVERRITKLKQTKLSSFAQELLQKEDEIKTKNQKLEQKKQEIDLSMKQLLKKIDDFSFKQKKFLACMDDVEKDKEKRITHLVDIIAGMKPASAAQVLSVQDASISVRILGLLPPQKVSKIFNLSEPGLHLCHVDMARNRFHP